MKRRQLYLALMVGSGLMLIAGSLSAQNSEVISGIVVDDQGPVAGAVVRVQTTDLFTETGIDGRFSLGGLPSEGPFDLTAWASGYYCVGPITASPGQTDVELILVAHPSQDNPDYAWLPSEYHPGQGEAQGCAQCHSRVGNEINFTLPVDEWRRDAHSQSAVNPRFLTMYTGTDVDGNQSPLTQFGYSRDYGRFPLRPDLSQPYYGPATSSTSR